MAYRVNSIGVLQGPLSSPDSLSARYDGLKTTTITLAGGFQKSPAYRAFRTSTVFERDIEIPLRDGTIIRGDVFRPAESQAPVPPLVALSPGGQGAAGRTRATS